MGPLEKLFALESPLARTTCQLMCDFRNVAQWVAVAISPQWPVRIARNGVLHTWEAYLGGMSGIIQDSRWQQALEALADRGVPVTLAGGACDPVPVTGRSAYLAARLASVESTVHPSAGHDLPISHPNWCVALMERALDRPHDDDLA